MAQAEGNAYSCCVYSPINLSTCVMITLQCDIVYRGHRSLWLIIKLRKSNKVQLQQAIRKQNKSTGELLLSRAVAVLLVCYSEENCVTSKSVVPMLCALIFIFPQLKSFLMTAFGVNSGTERAPRGVTLDTGPALPPSVTTTNMTHWGSQANKTKQVLNARGAAGYFCSHFKWWNSALHAFNDSVLMAVQINCAALCLPQNSSGN